MKGLKGLRNVVRLARKKRTINSNTKSFKINFKLTDPNKLYTGWTIS